MLYQLSLIHIFHQIYEDLAGTPPSLVEISQSWKELNHDWEYRFWNKNDIETFLKTYYPEFIPAYNAFPHNVSISFLFQNRYSQSGFKMCIRDRLNSII